MWQFKLPNKFYTHTIAPEFPNRRAEALEAQAIYLSLGPLFYLNANRQRQQSGRIENAFYGHTQGTEKSG